MADECFEDYILNSEFTFTVSGFARRGSVKVSSRGRSNRSSRTARTTASTLRSSPIIVMLRQLGHGGWLDGRAVGHIVMSTHWSGFAYIDELAVDESARRHGVARSLLDVAQFWSRKRNLPGIVLETQNNNLAACRLYERCGYVVGGVDHMRYRGIDPYTRETAIFWYLIFPAA